jgi:outer membrane biosynthesis protein TonB
VSSRTARAIQRNPVKQKQKEKKRKEKKRKEKKRKQNKTKQKNKKKREERLVYRGFSQGCLALCLGPLPSQYIMVDVHSGRAVYLGAVRRQRQSKGDRKDCSPNDPFKPHSPQCNFFH